MNNFITTGRKSMKAYQQKGFTLVELAIVLTIIGLLIGGILKGQQLINNAKVTAEITQFQALTAAITTFQDTYSSLPGDITNPTARLPSCLAAPCSQVGNGDGVVGAPAASPLTTTLPLATNENGSVFVHMARADLIAGISGTAMQWGQALPAGKVSGGILIQQMTTAPYSGLYGIGAVSPTAVPGLGLGANVFTPAQAGQIDRKMDDGNPATGIVIGYGLALNCQTAPQYLESSVTKDCALSVRLLN
jgi:prepilin-type N-terminal cleavage/methylation domain-containing protein